MRVQFAWGTDVGQSAIDILQVVEKARRNFPTDPTLQDPIVYKYDPSQLPILIYAVSGETDSIKLRTELDNEISPIIESANGVASAVVTGGNDRAILVNANPAKLLAYHVSMSQISQRIAQENQNEPAGIGKQSRTEYTIRALGWFTSPAQIAKVPLSSVNGRVITIGDVATVVDSDQEPRLFTRLNGSPAAGMIISKQSSANTIDTAKAVAIKLKDVEKRYPNLHFELAYDQSQYISNSINDLKVNAALGGVLGRADPAVLPAECSQYAGRRALDPDFDHLDIRLAVCLRVHAEHDEPGRVGSRHGADRRRCCGRAGEYLPPLRPRQDASCRSGYRRCE